MTTAAFERATSGILSGFAGRQAAITLVAMAIFLFFALFAPHFFTVATIFDVLRTASFTLLIGIPLTFLIIAGEIDLSTGSNYGFCTVMTAVAMTEWGWYPWLAGGLGLMLGASIGFFNGFVSIKGKVPSFILTLGMLSLLRGLALVIARGTTIDVTDNLDSAFFVATSGEIFGMPAQILWAAFVFAIGGIALRYSVFGAHVYATGGNRQAAMRMGVKPDRVRLIVFTAVGLACGLTAVITVGWMQAGPPNTGAGGELQVIAAVIIGGVALQGGRGTVYGTLIGALIVAMLQTGLVLYGVQGSWVQFFVGFLIVVAAGLELQLQPEGPVAELFRRHLPRPEA